MRISDPHNHQQCITDALQHATALCVAQGLRFTGLRRRVLELIWQAHKPIGAYDILAQLNLDGRKAAPPTVYRALDFLLEHGIVHRLSSLNAYIGCVEPGHANFGQFLICSMCITVIELHSTAITRVLEEQATAIGFLMKGQVIEIVGYCCQCAVLPR